MNNKKARQLRKLVFGDNTQRYHRTYDVMVTGRWAVKGLRAVYQYLKKHPERINEWLVQKDGLVTRFQK